MAPDPKYRAAASFPAMDEPARGFRFGALAHRNFRLFFLGQGVSLIGTWMQNVAQWSLVRELTNSPFYVGLVSALGSFGVLLLTLYAGVVVDRTNKHRLVILTQTLSMLPAFALAALVWSRAVAVWHVAALAAFLGVVNAFDIPARQSFIVDLVGKDDLMNAIALNSSAFNAARVIGPAVAGALIGVLGVGACFFLNGVSYLAVIAGLLAMRLPSYVSGPPAGSAWAGLTEAVAFIRGDRRIATIVVLMAVFSIFGFSYLVMMPVFARQVLHRGAAGYGLMMTAVGIGALIGALAVASLDRRIRKGPTLIAAGAAFGLLLVAFALSTSYLVSVVLLALTGGAMIVNNAVEPQPLGVHHHVVVHEIVTLALVVRLHILVALPVGLVHDLPGVRGIHAEPLDGVPDAPRLRRDDVHVERVRPLRQHRLCATPDEHDAPVRRGLGDHPLGHPHDRRLVLLDRWRRGRREEQLGRGGGERTRQPLEQSRGALLALRHLGGRQPGALGDLVHELVVDHRPVERDGDAVRDVGAAGGVLPGDRDDRRGHVLRASGSCADPRC